MYPLLAGLRVVDITSIILGPFATQILGDLGADVIKVEPLEGDLNRWNPPSGAPSVGAPFANSNRNKRSLALDLKSALGKEVLTRLIGTADALVHNMRAPAIERLGFGPKAVRAINPRIVYCAALGYGSQGPYAGRPAYDDIMQCTAGLAGLALMRDGEPAYHPTVTADKVTALHVVYAVLAALLHRERTGVALEVEMPMFEAMTTFTLNEHLMGATFAEDGALGYHRTLSRNRKPYRTKDGWIGLLPYTTEQWRRVLTALGRTDLTEEPWFADHAARSGRSDQLYGVLAERLTERTSAAWLAIFERADVPCGPMNRVEELLEDRHLKAIGFFEPHETGPSPVHRTLRQPLVVHDLEVQADRTPPMLGADNGAVLAELGYSARDVEALEAAGVIGKVAGSRP